MDSTERYKPLRTYCRQTDWPTLSQWKWWIYTKSDIADRCVKKLGGRYIIDLDAFEEYLSEIGLEGLS